MSIVIAFLLVNLLGLCMWGVYKWTGVPEWVDFGWGLFLWSSFMLTQSNWNEVNLVFAGILALWWGRIALHVWKRIRGGHKDERYQALKDYWGPSFERKFIGFYLLQSSGAFVLVLPFLALPTQWSLGLQFGIGALVLVLLGEILADFQLSHFKRSAPPGALCDQGLWRYSRHPNYFFELCAWLCMALMCVFQPWGWTALASFGLMLFLIFKVTGIPPIEKRAQRLKGQPWLDYKSKTSVLIPWFPRS